MQFTASPKRAGQLYIYHDSHRPVPRLEQVPRSLCGRVLKTYQTQARALGSKEVAQPGSRRFIIDFSGGDLAYYASDPSLVEVVPTSTNGKITRSFLVPNPHINGFRAAIDVALPPGQTTDLRAFL